MPWFRRQSMTALPLPAQEPLYWPSVPDTPAVESPTLPHLMTADPAGYWPPEWGPIVEVPLSMVEQLAEALTRLEVMEPRLEVLERREAMRLVQREQRARR